MNTTPITFKQLAGKLRTNKFLRGQIIGFLSDRDATNPPDRRRQPQRESPLCSRADCITVQGYLRTLYIEEHETIPEQHAPAEIPVLLAPVMHRAAMRHGSSRGDEIGHKLAFRLSADVTEKWKNSGVDSRLGLRWIINQTLQRYGRAAMQGEELGYAISIHHAGSGILACVVLMGFTDHGQPLKFSDEKQLPDGSSRTVNYHPLLTGTANLVLHEFQDRLTKVQNPILRHDAIQLQLQRWIHVTAWHHTFQRQLPEPQIADAVIAEISRLNNVSGPELMTELSTVCHTKERNYWECVQNQRTPSRADHLNEGRRAIQGNLQSWGNRLLALRRQETELRSKRRAAWKSFQDGGHKLELTNEILAIQQRQIVLQAAISSEQMTLDIQDAARKSNRPRCLASFDRIRNSPTLLQALRIVGPSTE